MKQKQDIDIDQDDGMKDARAGWNHMQQLIDKINDGTATEEEIREYNTAIDALNKVPRDEVRG